MILASASLASLVLSASAVTAYALSAFTALPSLRLNVRLTLLSAWALHGVLLALGLLAEPLRFGFAPALSVTAWLVLTVYVLESLQWPQLRLRWALAALGAVTVLLALAFPGSVLHPSTSAWLPLHWALGIACYGLFATAVVHAGLMMRTERQIRQAADPHSGVPLLTLERLTFRFVAAGFVLLSATLLAGWFFSEKLSTSAASGWRWNHKTVFSLLSWATFAVLLLGRARFGWRGRRAVRVLYAGAGLLLLAYVGSRFVLEVLLGRTP